MVEAICQTLIDPSKTEIVFLNLATSIMQTSADRSRIAFNFRIKNSIASENSDSLNALFEPRPTNRILVAAIPSISCKSRLSHRRLILKSNSPGTVYEDINENTSESSIDSYSEAEII